MRAAKHICTVFGRFMAICNAGLDEHVFSQGSESLTHATLPDEGICSLQSSEFTSDASVS